MRKNWPKIIRTAGEDTEAGQCIDKKVNGWRDFKQPKLDYFFFFPKDREN